MATKIDLVGIDDEVDFHPGGALPVPNSDKDLAVILAIPSLQMKKI